MDRANGGVSGAPGDNYDSETAEPQPYGTAGVDAPEDGYTTFRPYSDYSDEYEDYEEEAGPVHDEDESLRRQLAQFAFVREEDDREVRLFFRDVPAHEIARAFLGSGALLISMTGERAMAPATVPAAASPARNWASTEVTPDAVPPTTSSRKRVRKAQPAAPAPENPDDPGQTVPRPRGRSGELTMRYFFSMGEMVYTVNIAMPTGLVESIAGIFPVASQSERELHTRLAVVFREVGN